MKALRKLAAVMLFSAVLGACTLVENDRYVCDASGLSSRGLDDVNVSANFVGRSTKSVDTFLLTKVSINGPYRLALNVDTRRPRVTDMVITELTVLSTNENVKVTGVSIATPLRLKAVEHSVSNDETINTINYEFPNALSITPASDVILNFSGELLSKSGADPYEYRCLMKYSHISDFGSKLVN